MFSSEALAQGAAGAAGGASTWMGLLPFVAVFAVFYFLLIRPQQKKAREHQNLLKSLSVGDQIIVGGGLMGTVTKLTNEAEVEVSLAPDVKVRVVRSMIVDVISKKATTSVESQTQEKTTSPKKSAVLRKKTASGIQK